MGFRVLGQGGQGLEFGAWGFGLRFQGLAASWGVIIVDFIGFFFLAMAGMPAELIFSLVRRRIREETGILAGVLVLSLPRNRCGQTTRQAGSACV